MEIDSVLGVPVKIFIDGNKATVSVNSTTIIVTSEEPSLLKSKIECSVWRFLSEDGGKL